MKIGFLNDPNEPQQFNVLMSLQGLFEKCGIEFVTEAPDLILARQEALVSDTGRHWLKADKPIIILERADSSNLDGPTREVIGENNVIAVFKNRVLRQRSLYNYPTASEGRYHGKLINDHAMIEEAQTPAFLDPNILAKIKMVIWDIESSYAHPRYEPERKIWNSYAAFAAGQQDRDIDVLYLGTTSTYLPLINWHRQKFIDKMKGLSGLAVVTEGKYDYDTYVGLMRRTKVAVSPWGWGEWCWRDCEAVYFGCALAKPNTDFVLTYPDLFKDDNYYRCAADASDLAAAVNTALANWQKEIQPRFALRREMLEQMNIELLVTKLATALHDAYAATR